MRDDFLQKIEGDDFEIDFDKLKAFADSFDRGSRTNLACDAKLLMVVWQDGFNAAHEEMAQVNQQLMLMMAEVGGSA